MKFNSLTKVLAQLTASKFSLGVVITLVAVASITASFAQGTNNLTNGNAGNVALTTSNNDCAMTIRNNYFLRHPFAKAAFQCDTLVPATGGNTSGGGLFPTSGLMGGIMPSSSGGAGGGSLGGGSSAPVVGSGLLSAGSSSSSSPAGQGTLMSQLNTQPVMVRMLEPIVVPVGSPTGHYLPGALPQHQPQYASNTDAPAYIQPPVTSTVTVKTKRDMEIFQNLLPTCGVPASDTWSQIHDRLRRNRLLELENDPERQMWATNAQAQLQGAAASNAIAGNAESTFQASLQRIYSADGNGGGSGAGGGVTGGFDAGALINIANEQAGVPTASDNPWKTVPQAVWMVQQVYKLVFVPLAILFLLPGAVITQVKCQIVQGFNFGSDDATSPFEGILRAVIAIFLIPCTQLIVSYSIDVGNSMAYSVKDWVNIPTIFDWAENLAYNTPPSNVNNAILPTQDSSAQSSGADGNGGGGGSDTSISSLLSDVEGFLGIGGGGGGAAGGVGQSTPASSTIAENQTWLSQVMEVVFNMAMYLLSSMVIILSAYQLVFMCYLFLLGPLAAAFFAWPKIPNSSPGLFKDIWANWVNAVIVLSLWRFYWMVILAIMTQRILYIQQQGLQTNLQWEIAVFTCLLGLMMYVPFNPWSFDPGQAFEYAASMGSQMMQGMTQALGNAAIAGGASPAAVASMENTVNQTLAPFNQISNIYDQTQQAQMGVFNPQDQAGGASNINSAGGATGGTTSPSGMTNYLGSPPVSSQTVSHAPTPGSAQTTAPPAVQPEPGAANTSLVADASNGRASTTDGAPTSLTPSNPSGGTTYGVNAGASQGDVRTAAADPQSTAGQPLTVATTAGDTTSASSRSNASTAGDLADNPPPSSLA